MILGDACVSRTEQAPPPPEHPPERTRGAVVGCHDVLGRVLLFVAFCTPQHPTQKHDNRHIDQKNDRRDCGHSLQQL